MADPSGIHGTPAVGAGPRPPGIDPLELRTASPAKAPEGKASFKEVLAEAVGEVQRLQN